MKDSSTTRNTKNLIIRAAKITELEKLLEGAVAFTRTFGLQVAPGYIEFPKALDYALGFLKHGYVAERWWAYLFVHNAGRTLIGFGGFKGAPKEGVVEIGYGIAPEYRGAGYATEAASALLDIAFESDQVQIVRAHTRPERNASVRVLEKVGMKFMSETLDGRDGRVWRWQVARAGREKGA